MALGASKILKYYADPSNYCLSPKQDLALERYLDAIDAIGYDKAPKLLGVNWAQRWLKRHLKYDCLFDGLKSFINKLRILPRDTQYVYIRQGRQVFIPNANNCELVTLMECISTDSASITPIISDLLDNYLISVSDSGYMNNSLMLNWLKHFEKMTRRRQVGAWRLLLQFVEFPLNVGCFQPLKWYQGSYLDWAAYSRSKDINKVDFIATLEQIWRQTFTCSTICNTYSPTPPLAAVEHTIMLEILSSLPLAALSPTLMPIISFYCVKINLVVLYKHLPYKVAASGLKRELRCIEATKIAKDKRCYYKRYTLDAKVQQWRINDDVCLKSELTARKLCKITTVANKYKCVLPLICNYSGKYCKCAVHAKDNKAYNTKAISCLNYLERPYTSQLRDIMNDYPQTQSLYIKAENESQELPTQELPTQEP
ncbi:hypothetical protein P154DRAFT_528315, partial [Amniculicola lignicola CBS 123094]